MTTGSLAIMTTCWHVSIA